MIKRVVISFFLIVQFVFTYAQTIGDVSINLPDSIATISNLSFSCNEVIDARSNKNNIGLASRGGGYNNYQIVIKNDSSNILENTISNLFPINENKPELVVIIRNIAISEYIGTMTQIGYASIGLEFAKRIDTSLYSLGIFYANNTEQNSRIKYTHGNRLITSLKDCINQFNTSEWKSKEGIKINSLNKGIELDYKKLPPKGIYFDYDQITRNSPVPNVDFEITQSKKTRKYISYEIDLNDKINPALVQFVCDGNDLYMQADNGLFLKAGSYGKYIFFHGKLTTKYIDSRFNSTHAAVTIVLGFGSAFTSGLFFMVVPLNNDEVVRTNTSIKGVVIETETTELKRVTDLYLYKIAKPYPLMLKEYRKSKRKPEDQAKVIIELNKQFQ